MTEADRSLNPFDRSKSSLGVASTVTPLTASLARIISTAWLYSTLGLFFANSSVVSANARMTKRPPPRRMTVRLPVCCVVRTTGRVSGCWIQGYQAGGVM